MPSGNSTSSTPSLASSASSPRRRSSEPELVIRVMTVVVLVSLLLTRRGARGRLGAVERAGTQREKEKEKSVVRVGKKARERGRERRPPTFLDDAVVQIVFKINLSALLFLSIPSGSTARRGGERTRTRGRGFERGEKKEKKTGRRRFFGDVRYFVEFVSKNRLFTLLFCRFQAVRQRGEIKSYAMVKGKPQSEVFRTYPGG